MILLSSVIDEFGARFKARYSDRLLPGHQRALGAMQRCRTDTSRQMLVSCTDCAHQTFIPHSCGHRLCPHCQHFESQRWLDNQHQRRVPSEYFLLTFTVPREYRRLAFSHQRMFYAALMSCAWETINQFCENDKELRGRAGAIAVLHTHSRKLDFHPHVHLVVPAAAINRRDRHWRTRAKAGYLFSSKALASVFRGKFLARLKKGNLVLPSTVPSRWVVDCQSVGRGDKAITYLGKYLYRGVIREKDIVAIDSENITYRYTENTGHVRTRTMKGEEFLWQLVQHTLPKGFRRARNYGFLHPNSKNLIRVLQVLLLRFGLLGPEPKRTRPPIVCSNCGGEMILVALGLNLTRTRQDTEPNSPLRLPAM